MIEALIRITPPPNDSKIKSLGDIVCVKLVGSPWGREEVRRLMVVEIDDTALEAKLNEMKNAGEPHPVITNPYAVFDVDEDGNDVMVVRSSKKLDIEKLSAQIKADMADLTKPKPIIKGVTIMDKTDDEKPVKTAKVK